MMQPALFVDSREAAAVDNWGLVIAPHFVPACDLAMSEMNTGGVAWLIMNRWGDAVLSIATMMSIAMAVTIAVVRAEAMAVDGDILTVVPSFKTFPMLLACGFAAGVSHREKNGGLGHAFRDLPLANQLFVLGVEWIKKCRVLLDAHRRSATATG